MVLIGLFLHFPLAHFYGKVNFALFSLRRDVARPRVVIRTLSEKRLERLLTNEHGRSELLRNAKRDICTTTSVQLTHMEAAQDTSLVSNALLNTVAEQFAAGRAARPRRAGGGVRPLRPRPRVRKPKRAARRDQDEGDSQCIKSNCRDASQP